MSAFKRILNIAKTPMVSSRKALWKIHGTTGKAPKRKLKGAPVEMYLNPLDVGISRDLYIYGSREDNATAILKEYLSPGDCVLDLGANIGYFALLEADIVGPTGRIIAVEPGPENVAFLKRNVRANGFSDRIEIIEAAISEETGTTTLHLAERSNLHTINRVSCMDNYVEFRGTVDVRLCTIDSLIEEMKLDPKQVNVVRMDIEGHEVEAFAGMKNLLEVVESLLIFVEIHPKLIRERLGQERYEQFLETITSAGLKPVAAARSLRSRIDEKMDLQSLSELRDHAEAVELFLKK